MSILINMEMPKNCMACPLVSGYELTDEKKVLYSTVRCRLTKAKHPNGESVPEDCPLIELPSHGRLIDADAFDERIRVGNWLEDEDLPDDFRDGIHTTLLMLKSQRTIIEAEEKP